MRRFMAIVAVLIGLVALAGGIAGAVVVGSDDIVSTSKSLPHGASVAVSRPGLLDYDGWTMRVSATNADGEVFVGAGHPVDVSDYVRGVKRVEVTEVALGGLSTNTVEDKAQTPTGDPTAASFWTAQASGAGTQQVDLDLEAQPIAFYAGPLGESGALTLSVGLRIPRLFTYALALAAIGLALLVAGVVLLRRRPGGGEATDTGPTGQRAVPPTQSPAMERRRHSSVVVLGCVLALGGCGIVPQQAGTDPSGAERKAALTQADLAEVWKVYDRDNNAAIKAAHAPTFDPKRWASVDTGITLKRDHFQTAYAKAAGDRGTPPTLTHVAGAVYAPGFSAYPMHALTTYTATSTAAGYKADPSSVGVALLTRSRAAAGWRMEASLAVPKATLPKPAAAGAASTPSAADLTKARAAADAVANYFRTGKATIAVVGELKELRDDANEQIKSGATEVVMDADYFPGGSDATAGGAIRTIRVTGGLLAVVSWTGTQRIQAADGTSYSWRDQTTAKLLGQTGQRTFILRRMGSSALISIPDKGAATVLASESGTILNGS